MDIFELKITDYEWNELFGHIDPKPVFDIHLYRAKVANDIRVDHAIQLHFLRGEPKKAEELLLKQSDFFRSTYYPEGLDPL